MALLRPLIALWRKDKAGMLLIAAVTLLLCIMTLQRHRVTTNPMSRLITVERLVDAGTWAHASPGDSTRFPLSLDHVKVGDRIYSSKPPTYPLLMAGEAAVVKAITGWKVFDHQKSYVRLFVLLNQVLPYALMLLAALALLHALGADAWTRHFMVLALSVGILPFGYAATINNHTVSAVLLFLAFFLLWRLTRQGRGGTLHYALAGFLAGFAVANDLPAGGFLAGLLLLLCLHDWKRGAVAVLAAAIPFVVSALIYHSITGDYRPIYMQGGLYRYEGSYWANPEGWDAVHDPRWVYLLNITVGHHGLFSLSPVLLLALIGLPLWWRDRDMPLRREFLLILIFAVSVFLFVLFRTNNYGGYCVGLRWFQSFTPLLMFTAFPLVKMLGNSPTGKFGAVILLLASLPWNWEALYWEGFIQSGFEKWWMATLGI